MILMLSPQSYRWRRFSPGRESLWWWYQTMVLNMLARNLRGFSKSWNFHHYTSSPHHPKGNGTAEAAVKQAKRILKMSRDPGCLFCNIEIHQMSWHHQMRNWIPEEQEQLYQWNQSYLNPTWYQPRASYELQSRRSNRTRDTMIRKQSHYPLLL